MHLPFAVNVMLNLSNVHGWEIVRKMNIWPKNEASGANVEYKPSAKDIISRHTMKPERGLFIL